MPVKRHPRKDSTSHGSATPMGRDRSYVASLVDKRWDLLAEYKLEAVRAERARGVVHALRMMDELYATAKFWHPEWPTDQDREEDFETHRRVAASLARTRRSPSGTAAEDRRHHPRVRQAR